jgi:uncharacterized membrane protein
MSALYLFSVWLHIVAVVVWLGGMAFFALVIVPVTRREEFRAHAPALVHASGILFRPVGWICLALLLATGVVHLYYRGGWPTLSSGAFWRSPQGTILGLKLVLFALIVALSAVHDFIIGPRATEAGRLDPASPEARRYARLARWFGRLNLLLALAAVALGVMLVRGTPR